MKNFFSKFATANLIFALCALTEFGTHEAMALGPLSLESYLSQVKGENPAIKGAILNAQAGELISEGGKLLIAPTFFANAQFTSDAKVGSIAFFGFNSMNSQTVSLGVSQLTTFGLQAKLHYDIYNQYYVNPVVPAALAALGGGIPTSFSVASTVLEVNQSLWNNGFGRSTRANQERLQAEALAGSYSSSYQAKSILAQAEMSYWRLVLARHTLSVQKEAMDRAQKIHEWNSRRARLQLGDQADVLQAEALVQSRELDLASANNEVRSASRSFNSSRNIDSDTVSEDLVDLQPKILDDLKVPQRAPMRDDVKAAKERTRATIATAEMNLQYPVVDLFASLALNGQTNPYTAVSLSESMGYSFSFNRPTETIGLRVSFPINLGVTLDSLKGLHQQQIATEMDLDRKLFEQEDSWKNLNENLKEAKKHLELSQKLESIQQSKLNNERTRLQHGRSTTYQVLLFEQDFLLAQLLRIRDQANILNIVAQMKLFGETI